MPDACVDDGSCMPVPFCNTDPCEGDITTLSANNCSCELVEPQILGCIDENACNYDPSVNCDPGSCTYADPNFDCGGNCLVETDCVGNCGGTAEIDCEGICGGSATEGAMCTDAYGNSGMYTNNCLCDLDPIPGCTDNTSCNFNAVASIDDGSCLYNDCLDNCGGTVSSGSACDDEDEATVNDAYDENCNCIGETIPGCTDNTACNYNSEATIDDGLCTYPETNFDCDGNCIVEIDCTGTALIDCEGICNGNSIPGTICMDNEGKTGIYFDDCNCIIYEYPGCLDQLACNYNPNADTDDGSCTYPETNFDCEGNCLVEEDCNGTCGGTATIDCEGICNGSATEGETCTGTNGNSGMYNNICDCVLDPILGCTDNTACNFNMDADTNDGSCTYPETNFDCYGNCLVDLDCNDACSGTATIDCEGICDGTAIAGTDCIDINGNSSAYKDDCTCPEIVILGCIDESACNYNTQANTDDGSCIYPPNEYVTCTNQCLVDLDCNGECGGTAVVDCEGDCEGSAISGSTCLSENGISETYDDNCNCIIKGCTDATACNYFADANMDDGTCMFASEGYNCTGDCLLPIDCEGTCGGTAIEGSSCDDENPNTINDVYNNDCVCTGTPLPTCADGILNGNEEQIDCGGSCPKCIEDDLILSLTDPCNCIFGIDLNGDNINELAKEKFEITGGTPPFTVSNSTGNFYDASGNTLSNAQLTQLISNSILEVWVTADNSSMHTITIIDSNNLTASVSGEPCGVCPEFNPKDIPTLSQWSLIILGLILLSITTVSIIEDKTALMDS